MGTSEISYASATSKRVYEKQLQAIENLCKKNYKKHIFELDAQIQKINLKIKDEEFKDWLVGSIKTIKLDIVQRTSDLRLGVKMDNLSVIDKRHARYSNIINSSPSNDPFYPYAHGEKEEKLEVIVQIAETDSPLYDVTLI